MTVPKHIVRLFGILTSCYPNWQVSEATIETWAELLADTKASDLIRAAAHHVRTSRFPPTVAEILALSREASNVNAEEAWLEVGLAIKTVGYTGQPKWSHPQIERAVAAVGGWRGLCSTLSSDMGVARAHFLRCFDSYVGRDRDEEERTAIEGLAEFNARDLLDMDSEEMRMLDARTLGRLTEDSDAEC